MDNGRVVEVDPERSEEMVAATLDAAAGITASDALAASSVLQLQDRAS
jgi:hypothetical protein